MHESKPSSVALPETQEVAHAYRCVCGHLVSCQGETATCRACGREYDSEVIKGATAETALLTSDGSIAEASRTGPTEPTDDLIGKRLDHFLILSRIGRGGMGTVYRALDESLQRYVAIKVLRTMAGAGTAGMQQLFQEARAQARVNHPHVAHIYYVGLDAETPYLAMELVGHETLANRMSQGPLSFPLIVHVAQQITRALHAAAKFDIVHGDIKPANVLMVDDRTIKLSDFGLAYRLSDATTASGTTAGTPAYMPPEATKGGRIDHRGDMYSLGVALFEMTFERLPYKPSSNTLAEHLRQHRESAIDFPASWPQEIPYAWRGILQKLLNKNPDDRYVDFDALFADLLRVEPTSLASASILLRGLAWSVDSVLLLVPLALIRAATGSDVGTGWGLLGLLLSLLVCASVCLLQAAWGTTPGKFFFQIRIVDRYGLTPQRPVLALRTVFPFLWSWALAISTIMSVVPLPYFLTLSLAAVPLFYVAELASMAFGGGGTLHDRFLNTRVVLNA